MALKYYPLSRIIPNKYTRGGEYVTPDGKPYTGRYYTAYNGDNFTGINPVLGESLKLTSVAKFSKVTSVPGVNTLNSLSYIQAQTSTVGTVNANTQLTVLNSYYPVPLPSDYTRGYFTRYFAKNVSGPGFVIEISQLDWTKIQNGDVDSNTTLGYETMNMLWQLTGPLNDTRKSQYQIVGGVYSTNKRVTESKQKGFNGIVEYIGGDYTKFAKITDVTVATSGSI
jgi:hypothetical protein